MKNPIWISEPVLIPLHNDLIGRFGGSPGVRDIGLLQSALAKPQNLQLYGQPTSFDLAAVYAFGVMKNHPFIDGNKRTGFVLAILFLEINGLRFESTQEEVVEQTLALAGEDTDETAYAAWLMRKSS